MHRFTIAESLEFGWHKTRAHSSLVFQVLLTYFALQVVQAIVDKVLVDTVLGIVTDVVLAVAGLVLSAGVTVILLKLSGNRAAKYGDLVPAPRQVWHYACVSLGTGLLVVLGLVLLVVPGIYIALRLSMARFAVMDGAGIKESFNRSWHMTAGHEWRLLGFYAVLIGLNIAGALALLVGLLITLPVSALAMAHVYRKLKSKA